MGASPNPYVNACPRCQAERMQLCFILDKSIVRDAERRGKERRRSERVHKERMDLVRRQKNGVANVNAS